jgi:hypothetical protein
MEQFARYTVENSEHDRNQDHIAIQNKMEQYTRNSAENSEHDRIQHSLFTLILAINRHKTHNESRQNILNVEV